MGVAAVQLLIARMDHVALTALAMVEDRLADVLRGDADVLATLEIADAAAVDGPTHRPLDLLL